MFVNHPFHHSQPALVYGPDLERKFGLRTPIFTQVKLVKPGAKLLEPFERVRARHPGSLEVRHLRHFRILAPMRVRSRLVVSALRVVSRSSPSPEFAGPSECRVVIQATEFRIRRMRLLESFRPSSDCRVSRGDLGQAAPAQRAPVRTPGSDLEALPVLPVYHLELADPTGGLWQEPWAAAVASKGATVFPVRSSLSIVPMSRLRRRAEGQGPEPVALVVP